MSLPEIAKISLAATAGESPLAIETKSTASTPGTNQPGNQPGGDTIVATARPVAPASHPLQKLNAGLIEEIQDVDRAFGGLAALNYQRSLPTRV